MVTRVTYNWWKVDYGVGGFVEYCSALVASISDAQIHHRED